MSSNGHFFSYSSKSNNSDRFPHDFIARHPYPFSVGHMISFLDEFPEESKHQGKGMLGYCGVVDSRAKSEGDFLLSNIIGIDFIETDSVF